MTQNKRWEYKSVFYLTNDVSSKLAEDGLNGWELCCGMKAFIKDSTDDNNWGYSLFFKREIIEPTNLEPYDESDAEKSS